ncbi:5-oxoprolinase subunit PxpB [Celeribacter sp.]|uniref:5-oxoprolinase subunit PxpB n=1 Tax=Celeribacter sp. TaxID=1890673 RepID=UPI003A95100B
MTQSNDSVVFSDMGEAALLCEHPVGPLDLTRQRRIWAVTRALEGASGIRELVPGMNNLLVVYDPIATHREEICAQVETLWNTVTFDDAQMRIIEFPVVYGGEAGPDLSSLAEAAGLTPLDFATRHAQADYTVFALGAQPGFGYLGGLPNELAAPRRCVIHPHVEAGRIIIGGAQTAVQASTTPSGWHMIGRTDVTCFDPRAKPPTILMPGDRVRFRLIEVLS